jgi:hypothetical protein
LILIDVGESLFSVLKKKKFQGLDLVVVVVRKIHLQLLKCWRCQLFTVILNLKIFWLMSYLFVYLFIYFIFD